MCNCFVCLLALVPLLSNLELALWSFFVQFPFYLLHKIDLNHFRCSTLNERVFSVRFRNVIEISNLKQDSLLFLLIVCFHAVLFSFSIVFILRHRYVCVSSVWRLFLLNVVHSFQHFYNQKQNKKTNELLLIKVFVFTLTFLMLLFIIFICLLIRVYCVFGCVYLFWGLFDSKCLVLMPPVMNEYSVLNCPNNYRAHTNLCTYLSCIHTFTHSHHVDNNSQKVNKVLALLQVDQLIFIEISFCVYVVDTAATNTERF